MKISIQACLIAVLLISIYVHAEPEPVNLEKTMKEAAVKAVKTYRKTGMAGARIEVEDCYKNVKKRVFYCLYLDFAARHIDQLMVAANSFPPQEFFDDKAFGSRASAIYASAKMNKSQINDHLKLLVPTINRFVDEELSEHRFFEEELRQPK